MRTVKPRQKEAFAVYSSVCNLKGFLIGQIMRGSKMELKYQECVIL